MRTVYPEPGYQASDFSALLATRTFVYANCFRIKPTAGDDILLTTAGSATKVHTTDDEAAPVTFNVGPLAMSQVLASASVGLTADDQTVKVVYDQDAQIFGMPVASALRWGLLDGSVLETSRYYAPYWGAPWVGGIKIFRGRISSLDAISRTTASFKVKSNLILLDTQIPADYYQSSCSRVFGDAGCGVNRAALKIDDTVRAGSTDSRIYCPVAAVDDRATGTLIIPNAAGVYFTRSIIDVAAGQYVDVSYPFPFVPPAGTALEALPGCKRVYADCQHYNNTSRYRGYQYIPVAETAY